MKITNRLGDKILSSRFFGPCLGALIGVIIGHFICTVGECFFHKAKERPVIESVDGGLAIKREQEVPINENIIREIEERRKARRAHAR